MTNTHINALGKWSCDCELNTRFPWAICSHIAAVKRQADADDEAFNAQAAAPGFFYNPEVDYRGEGC